MFADAVRVCSHRIVATYVVVMHNVFAPEFYLSRVMDFLRTVIIAAFILLLLLCNFKISFSPLSSCLVNIV